MAAEQRRLVYGSHGTERLCGVCVLKRLGKRGGRGWNREAESFFSTSHLAARPWMTGAECSERRSEVESAWEALQKELERICPGTVDRLEFLPGGESEVFGCVDGSILYPERVIETMEELGAYEGTVADEARRAVKDFQSKAGLGEPGAYYAILLADGDRMGRVIDHQTGLSDHQELSNALDEFARKAKTVVDAHGGSLIYSGGDDVLALLPAHEALPCATELREEFAERLANWKDESGNPATLSAGIALVHHLHPLDLALATARSAESTAKQKGERNALAIIVEKRSGSPTTVCGKWGEFDKRLHELRRLVHQDAISAKAGYELAQLDLLLKGGEEHDDLKAAVSSLAIRILHRKRGGRGATSVANEVLARLEAYLKSITPAQLGQELYVAREIALAERQAGMEER